MNTRNTIVFILVFIIGIGIGYLITKPDKQLSEVRENEELASVTLPESTVELTKCVPGMGYHRADPNTLPTGPVYVVDADQNVIGIEYILLEEQLEEGSEAGEELILSAFGGSFADVSLEYEPEGLGEIQAPLYALHLYTKSTAGRKGVCEGPDVELEEDGHTD